MIFKNDLNKVAKLAGSIILKGYKKKKNPKYKDELKNVVTETDLEAEKVIISYLQKKFPNDSIFSEEKGAIAGSSSYLWVIDPLDGTANFSQSIPFFCVSIAVFYQGKPIEGIIYDPLNKMIFYAKKNGGAYLNGEKIKVSNKKLDEAICGFGFGDLQEGIKIFYKIGKRVRKLRFLGATALSLAYVACSFLDSHIVNYISDWDIAAGYLLVTEAGGKISDFQGHDINFSKDKNNIIATNKKIHNKFLDLKL